MVRRPFKKLLSQEGTKNEPNSYFVSDRKEWSGKSVPTCGTQHLVDFVFKRFWSTLDDMAYIGAQNNKTKHYKLS